jgi:hypothetical protein
VCERERERERERGKPFSIVAVEEEVYSYSMIL